MAGTSVPVLRVDAGAVLLTVLNVPLTACTEAKALRAVVGRIEDQVAAVDARRSTPVASETPLTADCDLRRRGPLSKLKTL